MRDNAREHPASLGDSRKFGTKQRKVLASIGTTCGDGNHLEAKSKIGALISVINQLRHPSPNVQKGGDGKLRFWRAVRLGNWTSVFYKSTWFLSPERTEIQ